MCGLALFLASCFSGIIHITSVSSLPFFILCVYFLLTFSVEKRIVQIVPDIKWITATAETHIWKRDVE